MIWMGLGSALLAKNKPANINWDHKAESEYAVKPVKPVNGAN